MADLPAGAHPCPDCSRPIWGKVERCGACQPCNRLRRDENCPVSAVADLADPKVDPDPQEGP